MSMMYGRYRTMMYEQYMPRVVMILRIKSAMARRGYMDPLTLGGSAD
jgi:hypothetical protein